MSCECRVCKQGRYIDEVIKGKDFDKLVAVVGDLQDQLAHAETDNKYYENILKGTWPSAKEILTDALRRCEETSDIK
jgi:hypothetical protein